ncbi:MAG: M24 family metallopeptidase [Gemmatimonadota bacterium]
MAHTAQRAHIDPERLLSIQAALRERNLDGWLLYDYHGTNPIANRVLGLPQPMSRRYFALLPAQGRPVVVAHTLEQPPWSEWAGPVRVYFTWEELEAALAETLTPGARIAVETSAMDRIPQLDRIPTGVLELIEHAGVHPTGSSELVTLFASAWSDAELESHRRAARVLAEVAESAFRKAAAAVREELGLSEWELKAQILDSLSEAGLVDIDSIVAVGANSADGHYEPTAKDAAPIEAEQVLLIDLWGREPGSVYADQTWMGYTGNEVPKKVSQVWQTVRGARQAALESLAAHAGDDNHQLRGCDVDAASRAIVEEAGYGEYFIHRTGHSIDSELHGFGPNIDGVETKDERRLLPGIGFSIEPGVYLPGEFGVRSEINVHLSSAGPEVTTPNPQDDIFPVLNDGWLNPSAL